MKQTIFFKEIEQIIGYKFNSHKLLETAFTHSSYSNENHTKSNEKLEFLGDAIIEFVITEILYKEFEGNEGELSKIRAMIVSEKPLAETIDRLDLSKFMLKGKGERNNTTESTAIKCDLFEAIVGAIYIDGGLEQARNFFIGSVSNIINSIKQTGYVDDAKTRLQETLKTAKIVYSTSKTGADHMPTYKTVVFVNDKKLGVGEGSNKKTAEENAASQAINNLKKV